MKISKTQAIHHGCPTLRIDHSACSNGTVDKNQQDFPTIWGLFILFYFPQKIHIVLPAKPIGHLLDASIAIICSGFREGSQDTARDPSFSCWRVVVCGLVHQEHVLLVDSKDLNHLSLIHTDLILLQCIVIFNHHHGRGPIAPSQISLQTDTTQSGERPARRNLPLAAIPLLVSSLTRPGKKTQNTWKFTLAEKDFKHLEGGSNRIQTNLLFHITLQSC